MGVNTSLNVSQSLVQCVTDTLYTSLSPKPQFELKSECESEYQLEATLYRACHRYKSQT